MKKIKGIKKLSFNVAERCAELFITEDLKDVTKDTMIVGALRRFKPNVAKIEIVCTISNKAEFNSRFHDKYPGISVNDTWFKRFKYPKSGVQIDLYISRGVDFGRDVAILTGPPTFSHHILQRKEKEKGWFMNSGILRLNSEYKFNEKKELWAVKPEFKGKLTKHPVFKTELDYFKFLGIDYISPEKRIWISPSDNK